MDEEKMKYWGAVEGAEKIKEYLDHHRPNKANLGLATTGELIDEIRARIEIHGNLNYKTVDDGD